VIDQIRKLFEYDNWATERVLNALEGVDAPKALETLGHILAAKRIWLLRLNGEDSSATATFPELGLADCRKLASELAISYAGLLASLNQTRVAETVTYKNTKGVEFTTPIGEILTHLAIHGAYHRGQIALLLRQGGDAAVNTDFITFARL
jgi:uncharacterized damage-inducible protein DinB